MNEDFIKKISSIENMVNNPKYHLENYSEEKIEIKIDDSMKHGSFRRDPMNEKIYYTTSQTFRAMKKDIFLVSDPDDLKEPYDCHSCKAHLDLQFWHFCPYCGEAPIKDL